MEHSDVQEPLSPWAFFGLVGRQVWNSLATLTFLTLVAVALHHFHVFDATEGVLRRMVLNTAVGRQMDEATTRRADATHGVSVVMLDAFARINELEMDSADLKEKSLIDRVAGARPIDRCKFADVITSLANQLQKTEHSQYLKVVGLDVDIAPVADNDRDHVCNTRMAEAVEKLRKSVAVVAIVMDRESEELRNVRNNFYGKAGIDCTLPETVKESKAESGSSTAAHHLYLASPRVFHSTYSYPIDFPSEAKAGGSHEAASSWRPPTDTVFPSLSNLLLATAFRSGDAFLKSATMLCEQALMQTGTRESRHDRTLLEDRIGERFPDKCSEFPGDDACLKFSLDRYASRPVNWRWILTDDVHVYAVSKLTELSDYKLRPDNDYFSAAALIVGVDGGAGYDKFSGTLDAIPGAALHALQAVSVQDGSHVLYLQSIWALLADFAVGLAFLFAWKALSLLLDRGLPGTASRQLLKLVLPVALAVLLGWFCLAQLAPFLLNLNIWANPLYLLAGLVLHAYVEGAEGGHEESEDPAHEGPDFTFGVGAAWDRWRSQRRWNWQLADAGFCALLKWVVIGIACWELVQFEASSTPFIPDAAFWHGPGIAHWGGWAVVVLLITAIVAFVKRPTRSSTCADTLVVLAFWR